jgi:hypothetical protein
MANIIPALSNDTLGIGSAPWKSVIAKQVKLTNETSTPSITENALYVINNVLYFNGSVVGSSVSSASWKAYELAVEFETESMYEVWVSGASIVAPANENYPVQARVLYNGVEILPSNLTFEVGTYGDLFNIEPGSITEIDPSEQGTKITINIPEEDGQAFIFEVGASILVWNNE